MTFTEKGYQQYSILIAEADRDCRQKLQKVLMPAGFKTYVTESGIEAIDIVNSEAIHLLILDTILRGMGGLDVFRFILEKFPPMPCILLSDYISKEDQISALCARVSTIMPKPLNFRLVRETVDHLIERYYINR